jgi:hypothetical protein
MLLKNKVSDYFSCSLDALISVLREIILPSCGLKSTQNRSRNSL